MGSSSAAESRRANFAFVELTRRDLVANAQTRRGANDEFGRWRRPNLVESDEISSTNRPKSRRPTALADLDQGVGRRRPIIFHQQCAAVTVVTRSFLIGRMSLNRRFRNAKVGRLQPSWAHAAAFPGLANAQTRRRTTKISFFISKLDEIWDSPAQISFVVDENLVVT